MNRARASVVLFLASGLSLGAHELFPTELNLRFPGPTAIFTLSNGGNETGCSTLISVEVEGDAVTVTPTTAGYTTPPDTLATFTVTPRKAGTAKITVKWSAGISSTCNGSGSPQIAVTVTDSALPPPPPTYEKVVAEPISMATGAFLNFYLDLRLRGPFPIYFERYYNSSLTAEGQVASALGANWMHNYDLTLSSDGALARVTYYYGQSIRFTKSGGAWTQASMDPFDYQLLQSGTTYRMLDPFAHLVYTFDGATGKLQSVQDRNGNAQTLTYTGGRLTRVADGMGASLDFSYNTGGALTRVADQTGRSFAFNYTQGVLTAAADGAGQTTVFSYSSTGALLTAYRLPHDNVPYTNTYDSNGRVVSQRDAAGNVSSFTYNPALGASTMSNPLLQVSRYTHANRNQTREVDPAGNVTTMTYDTRNRQISRTDAAGNVTTFSFHPDGLVRSVTSADGTTSYFYASSQVNGFTYQDLTTVSYPDGSSESFEYDQSGNVITRVSRTGQRWTSTYNSHGQPLTLTAPNGARVAFTYTPDSTSALASIQLPETSVTTFRMDGLKRLSSKRRSDGSSVSYTYDAYDHVLTATNEVGAVTTWTYDVNGLVASVRDPVGNTTSVTRTPTDQVAAIIDGAGRVWGFRYDALDRPSTLIYGDGSTFQIGYDAAGNAVTFTDGEGKVWRQGYDAAGVENSFTTPLGNRLTLTLDRMGRTSRTASAGGKNSGFAYDAMGRLTTASDPLLHDTVFRYDQNGRLLGLSAPAAISAGYTRDAAGNLTALTDPNGAKWNFSNDGLGRLLTVTDPLGQTTTYRRDARGRIAQVALPLGAMTATLDAAGRLTNARFSDNTSIDYQWNAASRLVAGSGLAFQYDTSGLLSNSNGLAITRDQVSRVSTVTLAPGKAITYQYDRRGLVTGVTDWLSGSTTLQYDDDSRLVSLTRPNGVTTSYTYDADGDIASLQEAGAAARSSISLTRDQRGYVTRADRNVPLSPTADQLAAFSSAHRYDAAGQIAEFRYDAMGRRVADDSRSYTWDLASRLAGYAAGSDSSAFTHNAAGLVSTQTRGGVTRQFIWNFGLALPSISVVRSNGADFAYFVHTPEGGLLYSVDTAGRRRYYHYDEMGNTIFLTDDAGAIVERYAYSEYGALLAPAGFTDQLFLFEGQFGLLHLGNSLYAARQRIYDSGSGAFLSRDPNIQLSPRLVSPYTYAAANPLHFFDITGAGPGTIGSDATGTTVEVVNDVGGASGVAATHIGEKAARLENLVNDLHIPAGLEGVNELEEGAVQIKWAKQATKLKNTAKPLGKLGKAGSAAQVAAVGIEAYKFNNAIKQAESEDDRNREGNYQTYQTAFANIQLLYEQGKISAIQRNNLKLQAQFAYDEAMLATDSLLEFNLIFEGTVFVKNGLGTFVPVPLNWIGLAPEEKGKAK